MRYKSLFEASEFPDVIVKKKTHEAIRNAGYSTGDDEKSLDSEYEDVSHRSHAYGKVTGTADLNFPHEELSKIGWTQRDPVTYTHPNGHMIFASQPIKIGDSFGHPLTYREMK